jgi:hypothetical protein
MPVLIMPHTSGILCSWVSILIDNNVFASTVFKCLALLKVLIFRFPFLLSMDLLNKICSHCY